MATPYVPKPIEPGKSFNEFLDLLKSSGLPSDDLMESPAFFYGFYDGEEMVGTGGLEIHDDFALLRSLSVKLGVRGQMLGSTITDFLISEARKKNARGIYLLTDTARDFFYKKGFRVVSRENDVPDAVKASTEFLKVCPVSATCMYLSF